MKKINYTDSDRDRETHRVKQARTERQVGVVWDGKGLAGNGLNLMDL